MQIGHFWPDIPPNFASIYSMHDFFYCGMQFQWGLVYSMYSLLTNPEVTFMLLTNSHVTSVIVFNNLKISSLAFSSAAVQTISTAKCSHLSPLTTEIATYLSCLASRRFYFHRFCGKFLLGSSVGPIEILLLNFCFGDVPGSLERNYPGPVTIGKISKLYPLPPFPHSQMTRTRVLRLDFSQDKKELC
jgi:hypothetical protein